MKHTLAGGGTAGECVPMTIVGAGGTAPNQALGAEHSQANPPPR